MVDSAHSISLQIDSSSGVKSLEQLKSAVKDTSAALKELGSSAGGGGFSSLNTQISQLSAGFDRLKSQAASVNNIGASISRMSSGASGIKAVATELGLLATVVKGTESAFSALEAVVSAAVITKLGADIQKVGSSLLSMRFSLDAVATSATEAGEGLAFIEGVSKRTGSSLADNIESYKQLAGSMRPLGKSVAAIQHVYEGFTTAMSVMHVPIAQQKIAMRELAETYSQGHISATVALRAMGSHISGMSSILQSATGKTGEQMHAMFKAGGLDLETWDKAATILLARFGSQLPESLNHSVAAVTLLENAWTKAQQVAFEGGGFDKALTTLAQSLQLTDENVQKLGVAIGSAFAGIFSGAAKAVAVIKEFKEPLRDFALVAVSLRAITLGFSLLSMASGPAVVPILALAVGFAVLRANWSDIKEAFSHAGEVFDTANAALARYTAGWADLRKAMLGAVELWSLAKGLFSGKSLAESKQIAGQSGLDFESGKSSGTKFFEGVYTEAKSYATQVKDLFADLLPDSVSGGTQRIEAEWKRIDEMNKPHKEAGAGQYSANQKHYDEINSDRALSTELEKLFLKLNPVTAALKTYREELQKISEMKGKTVDGQAITDSQINAMKDNAKQTALKDFAPQTEKIQALLDSVKIERDARAAVGDEKDALESERAVLTWKNEMLRKNVTVTNEEVNAVRELLKAQAAFSKESENGFKKFADESKDVTKTLNDSIKSSMDSIAEGISKIVVDGKGKFKNLGQAIRAELKDILKGQAKKLIDAGIKGLMSQAISSLGLDKLGQGDGAAALKKALGLGQSALDSAGKKLDDSVKTVADMAVTASVVNITGVGALNGAFNSSGGNPSAVGGITPTPLAPSTPVFGSSAITSPGLGIPGNSAAMFGSGLSPSAALAPLGALATSINAGSSNAGIDANSLASFGQLVNLQNPVQPTAANIGVAPPSAAISGKSGGGDANAAVLWDSLKRHGFSDSNAAKVMGNTKSESAFDPNARRVGDAGPGLDSVGLQQWNRQRKSDMESDVSRQFGGRPYNSLSPSEKLHGQADYVPREIMGNPDYKAALNKPNAGEFGKIYEGFSTNTVDERTRNGNHYLQKFGGSSNQSLNNPNSIDNTPTGSIKPVDLSKTLDPSLKASASKWQDDMAKASKASSGEFTADVSKDIKAASSSGNGGGTGFGNVGTAAPADTSGQGLSSGGGAGLSSDAGSAMGALTGLAASVTKLGGASKISAQGIASMIPQLTKLLASLLGGLGGGAGGAAGGVTGGLFSEGGLVGSPVSSATMSAGFWSGAPHFSEGGVTSGIPIIAHPGESIVPLSRGRSIPVELRGNTGGNVTNHNHVTHVNLSPVAADSFRKNIGQIATEFNRQTARHAARNG
jgi:hypothetical protein